MAAGSELADLIWEAPDQFTADHARAFRDAMCAHLAGDAERAGQLWENLLAIWSHAWSANYAVLEFMQGMGLSRFAPVKPQHWVIASFEHHTKPPRPSPPPRPQHRPHQLDHRGEVNLSYHWYEHR